MPSLGQISSLITLLKEEQGNDHLKAFDLSSWSRLSDIFESKTDKQIKFINALIINNKYSKLNNVLTEWGI